jgi:GNAT superfamily N-acetyltransferase
MRAEVRSGIREASAEDAPAVAAAVEKLLIELGGARPSLAELEAAARELAEDPEAGALLVAETGEEIVGVLAASWQQAIHVPGRYGTIQDLWVLPAWRSRAIGHDLLEALRELATELGIKRLEVGLPQEGFERLGATEAFYRNNGFAPLGPRMRLLLP